jgi:hypothetical protein
MTEPSEGKPRVVRKSPLEPVVKLCPKCMEPLQRGSKFGGWLIPQDYYCDKCGYKGVVYLEKPLPRGEGD